MRSNEYKFDPADWQGRRQDQVESSYKIIGWTVVFGLIWTILAVIIV